MYKKYKQKQNTIYRLFLMLLASSLMLACSKQDQETVIVNQVLLVYLAGDNNLSSESHEKLVALSRGYDGSRNKRILIYKDSRDQPATLYEANGKGSYTTIESYGEENSADPKIFARVIQQAKVMYPQASFNLLVFSHASGWLPSGSFADPSLRSVLVDGKDEMEFLDFAASIPNNMFHLIAFDACHMAGVEIAYQLRDKAKYIAASSAEILSPGFTPVYEQYADDLITGNYKRFMQQAFNYFDSNSGYMRSSTLSVIQTQGLDELAVFVKQNCNFETEVNPAEVQHFDRGSSYLFCDLGDYYSRLLSTPEQRQNLQRHIEDCLAWSATTPSILEGYNGFTVTTHSGMTAYIPQKRYSLLNTSYANLDWSIQIFN